MYLLSEDMLFKQQEYLEKKIEVETATIKRTVKTNKQQALRALKRKKRMEKKLQMIDGTLTTVEQQRVALEGANSSMMVLQAMKEGSRALKVANGEG